MKFMEKKFVLKSCSESEYPDLEVTCKYIKNEDIASYLTTISDDDKFYATKTACVIAKEGKAGEKVYTKLFTTVGGKKYILHEEDGTVKERVMPDGSKKNDMVVTNVNSTSNERYVVDITGFDKKYKDLGDGFYEPTIDYRMVVRVPENVMIETLWGEPAIALKGSFIVVYDEATNDYNTVEAGAFYSTYETVPTYVDDNAKINSKQKKKTNN